MHKLSKLPHLAEIALSPFACQKLPWSSACYANSCGRQPNDLVLVFTDTKGDDHTPWLYSEWVHKMVGLAQGEQLTGCVAVDGGALAARRKWRTTWWAVE